MKQTDLMGVTRRTVLRSAALGTLAVSSVGLGAAQGQGQGQKRGNNEADRYDEDGNGFPDEGVEVTGMYKAVVAYDADGNMYMRNPSGIGREIGNMDDLNQETLTTCDYKVQYRGTFANDPYQDTGWIRNNVVCTGYEPDTQTILWVHETDPRYTGNGEPAFGGDWEVRIETRRGRGNLPITDETRPQQP